ncbi:hypothetical protein LCGC14_1866180 [marine sediment metagenome]|uniref:Uncharacterized protein n=1 Tax=marine sediment metagenome TaxID=412755 RepID=A0A0F9IKJ8_9ZZZZ
MPKLKGVKISEKLHDYLLDRATKRESFEDVIWRLIGMKEISKEDLKQIPPKYVGKLNQGKKIK